jgi:hypothetical protein
MAKIGIHEIENLVRVGESVDYKGNPVMVLEILGVPVRYARPQDLPGDPENWQDAYRERLASALAHLVVFEDQQEVWRQDSPTGREVYPLGTDS